eukprot:TRINITY_DN67825_c5_g7_i1.p1 TRINITY_DN67825_c5_g7~~TRINITY_DN67825_c5_g7_i1.p1  ORF type:complete len:123 (-),score=2.16 TRINITY_DN67825_c5_g7_i1:617-985(-)
MSGFSLARSLRKAGVQSAENAAGHMPPQPGPPEADDDYVTQVQHGGLTPEQVHLFVQCIKNVQSAFEIADIFKSQHPGMSWSIVRCPTKGCDIHLESAGFACTEVGDQTVALIANPKSDDED